MFLTLRFLLKFFSFDFTLFFLMNFRFYFFFICQYFLKKRFQVILFLLSFIHRLFHTKNLIYAFLTFWKSRLNLGRIFLEYDIVIFRAVNIPVFRLQEYRPLRSFIVQSGRLYLVEILRLFQVGNVFEIEVFYANILFLSRDRFELIMLNY